MFETPNVDRRTVPEPSLAVSGAAVAVASTVVSLLASTVLTGEVRIHWSAGGPYYGPEFAPAWLVLGVFPALVGALALGAYGLKRYLARQGEFDELRGYYELGTLAVLGVVVLSQCLLVAANL